MDSMSPTQVSASFYLALVEFLLLSKQRVAAIGEQFGLTSIQAITLLLLDPNNPRPMKNLCSLYRCDASNVTGIIDGLEQKGLVSRQNDPHDRRIKVVCMELKGTALQQQILEALAAENGYLFDPLTADEAEQFVTIVRKIAAAKTPTCSQ